MIELVNYIARDIINLIKIIISNSKYSGQGNNFDFKLTIFNNYYNQLSITNNTTKAKVYLNILKETTL